MQDNFMNITKEEEAKIRAIVASSPTMKEATNTLGYSRSYFRGRAKKLGIWNPTPKGTIKPSNRFSDEKILEGVNWGSFKLKKSLIDRSYLKDECCRCGWKEKRSNAKYTSCHLHHKDGNDEHNEFENLEILCPNCHSLTPEYCRHKKSTISAVR